MKMCQFFATILFEAPIQQHNLNCMSLGVLGGGKGELQSLLNGGHPIWLWISVCAGSFSPLSH